MGILDQGKHLSYIMTEIWHSTTIGLQLDSNVTIFTLAKFGRPTFLALHKYNGTMKQEATNIKAAVVSEQ